MEVSVESLIWDLLLVCSLVIIIIAASKLYKAQRNVCSNLLFYGAMGMSITFIESIMTRLLLNGRLILPDVVTTFISIASFIALNIGILLLVNRYLVLVKKRGVDHSIKEIGKEPET